MNIYSTWSDDGGANWESDIHVTEGDNPANMVLPDGLRVCIYEDGGTIYLRESTDQGRTWSAAYGSVTGRNPFVFCDSKGITWYRVYHASGQVKFQYSRDRGATWAAAVNVAASVAVVAPEGVAYADGRVFVSWYTGGTWYQYRNNRIDGGGTWTSV